MYLEMNVWVIYNPPTCVSPGGVPGRPPQETREAKGLWQDPEIGSLTTPPPHPVTSGHSRPRTIASAEPRSGQTPLVFAFQSSVWMTFSWKLSALTLPSVSQSWGLPCAVRDTPGLWISEGWDSRRPSE